MKVYVTSNQQFGRTGAIKAYKRSFEDVSEMNNHLIKQWNSVVKDGDAVFVLGNLVWDPETGEEISYVIFDNHTNHTSFGHPPTLKGGEYDKKNFMSEEELAEYHELKETTQALPSDDVEEFYLTRASIYDPKEWIQKWLSEDYGHNRTD